VLNRTVTDYYIKRFFENNGFVPYRAAKDFPHKYNKPTLVPTEKRICGVKMCTSSNIPTGNTDLFQ